MSQSKRGCINAINQFNNPLTFQSKQRKLSASSDSESAPEVNIFADPTPEELMGFVPQRQAAKKASAHLREPDQKTSLAIDRAEDQNNREGNRSPKKSPVGAKGRHGKKVRLVTGPDTDIYSAARLLGLRFVQRKLTLKVG